MLDSYPANAPHRNNPAEPLVDMLKNFQISIRFLEYIFENAYFVGTMTLRSQKCQIFYTYLYA